MTVLLWILIALVAISLAMGFADGSKKPETAPAEHCDLPPEGWYCTREKGHEGPCAAWPEYQVQL